MHTEGPLSGRVHGHAEDGEDASTIAGGITWLLAERVTYNDAEACCVLDQNRITIDVTAAGAIPVRGGGTVRPSCCAASRFFCPSRCNAEPGFRIAFELESIETVEGRLVARYSIEHLRPATKPDDKPQTVLAGTSVLSL